MKPELILSPDTYSDESYRGITELSRALQGEAAVLTPYVTQLSYAMGGTFTDVNFPMLALTEGASKMRSVDNFEYKYPVMGRYKKTSIISRTDYSTSAQVGLGNSAFYIWFSERWFYNQQTLYIGPNLATQFSLRVEGDPVQIGNSYRYTVKLLGANPSNYISGAYLQAGRIVGGGVAKVAFEDSDGTESRTQLNGMATNMTSLVRKSVQIKGNVQNKVMKYIIKVDGKAFTSFIDWSLFLADIEFKNHCEEDLWWSVYGKSTTGQFTNIDTNTDKPITMGSGIDEQITNSVTFSTLSYDKLAKTIRDVCFSVGSKNANITLWTGTGGAEDFNDAMITKMQGYGFTLVADQFIQGKNSYDMTFGSFFKSFRHQDGHMITIMKHPIFDRGIKADIADKHPRTGLPLTSHSFYFVDMGTYEGKSNVEYVYEKGREYQQFALNGAIKLLGYDNSNVRISSKDSASMHMIKSQGIQIYNSTACFKMYCTAS
jgi:hypothetical protein